MTDIATRYRQAADLIDQKGLAIGLPTDSEGRICTTMAMDQGSFVIGINDLAAPFALWLLANRPDEVFDPYLDDDGELLHLYAARLVQNWNDRTPTAYKDRQAEVVAALRECADKLAADAGTDI
jgi:hypothetical protein